MPSPFPGMDPFIELQEWEDFHPRYVTVLSELLTPQVRPRYVVRVERRVYLERALQEPERAVPDVAMVQRPDAGRSMTPAEPDRGVAVVECLLPVPEEHREYYLVIRDRETFRVVTVIELLSPTNKRPGSVGREQYLEKREEVLQSRTSLVELDLLRGGQRMPMGSDVPAGDYYAVVRRGWQGRRALVYAWTLRQRMPAISVPLEEKEAEATLDLQAALGLTYDRAAYQDSLDYSRPLEPPPAPQDASWIEETLRSKH